VIGFGLGCDSKLCLQMVQDTLTILPSDLYVDHSVHPTLCEGCFKRKNCAVFLKCTFLDCFYDKGAEEIFDIHVVKGSTCMYGP
jgi:hypothetical protein